MNKLFAPEVHEIQFLRVKYRYQQFPIEKNQAFKVVEEFKHTQQYLLGIDDISPPSSDLKMCGICEREKFFYNI